MLFCFDVGVERINLKVKTHLNSNEDLWKNTIPIKRALLVFALPYTLSGKGDSRKTKLKVILFARVILQGYLVKYYPAGVLCLPK